jgi:hypothetical protein
MWKAILREAVIVFGGAIIASYAIGQVPQLRDWMRKQWQGAGGPTGY